MSLRDVFEDVLRRGDVNGGLRGCLLKGLVMSGGGLSGGVFSWKNDLGG